MHQILSLMFVSFFFSTDVAAVEDVIFIIFVFHFCCFCNSVVCDDEDVAQGAKVFLCKCYFLNCCRFLLIFMLMGSVVAAKDN